MPPQNQDTPDVSHDIDQVEEPSVSLVEIEPGIAVLFADEAPENLEVFPFDAFNQHSTQELTDKLSVAAGMGNLLAQGTQGLANVQGLVRLAPETLQWYKIASPMTSGGWNLGPIVNSRGTIVAHARFAPVAGVQSATLLATLGPAAVLLAMQIQLASISRRLDENLELTRGVIRAIHEDQWTTLLGLHETTLRAVREARAAGVVNDHIYSALATKEADLRKQRHLFSGFVRRHVKALATDPKSQRAYIQENIEQIIADVHGILMAEHSWYRTQVLRTAHINNDTANAAQNEKLLAQLVDETAREHEQAMAVISGLLTDLERQTRLMAELPAERSLPFTSKRRSIRDTSEMVQALTAHVADLRNQALAQPAQVEPTVVVFEGEAPEDLPRILRWVLPPQDELLAIADANLDRLLSENVYLGVTPREFFISNQNTVRKQGVLEQSTPLSDIRYVRFKEREKKGPVLDVITKDENIRVTFDDWAAEADGLESARRIGNLLAAAMELPESERRTDPLLHGKTPELSDQSALKSSTAKEVHPS